MIKMLNKNKEINILDDKDFSIEENSWVHLTNPDINTIGMVYHQTNIDKDLLITSIDDEETAHIDVTNDTTLIVVDIPYVENGYYCTIPFSILFNEKFIITVCTRDFNIMELVSNKTNLEVHKHVRLSIQILYRIANLYIQSLRKIDEMTSKTEQKIIKSMKNKEILTLMNINKSLVHFSTSLNSNQILINKLSRMDEFKKYEQDYDLMEDLKIEQNQAVEMCQIYRDILSGSMDSFSNIISNNMNNSMQTLAYITLALSFPTLVASIYGMNVELPFMRSDNAFYVLLGFSILLSVSSICIIYKLMNKRKIN